MMFLHRLPLKIKRQIGSAIHGGKLNTGTVTLHWDAAAAPADENVEADYAEPDPLSATQPALIHYVSIRAGERAFTEFEAGDCIVSFTPEVMLAGKRGLYFTLPDGRDYVQAGTGKSVSQYWDAYVGGEPMSITLLLRIKK